MNNQCTSDTKRVPGLHRPRRLQWDVVARLFARACEAGGTRKGLTRIEWDVAGNCERSVLREYHGVPPGAPAPVKIGDAYHADGLIETINHPTKTAPHKWLEVGTMSRHPLTVEVTARCRECQTCLAARATHWRLRAVQECRRSYRTWFGTLTLRPAEQYAALCRARQVCGLSGVDYDTLSRLEQFREKLRAIGPDLTKFIKRLRKTGARFRYFLVAEAHESGEPHFHVLLHETNAALPIRHAALAAEWKLGFSKFRLATDPAVAGYVCKYLTKTLLARVRASEGYGEGLPQVIANPIGVKREIDPPHLLLRKTRVDKPAQGA